MPASTACVLSGFDYETSARVTHPGRGRRRGQGPGLGAAAGRHLPQPAGQARRRRDSTAPSVSLTCGIGPVQPADDAGRGLPGAAGDAGRRRHGRAPTSSPPRSPRPSTAAGRDDMLPVLTGVRIEIEGSTIALLATDRYRLSLRESSGAPTSADLSATALVPARVLADTAKSLTSSGDVTHRARLGGHRRRAHRLRGGGRRQRATTTRLLDGEFPKVRALFPTESAHGAHGRHGRPDRGGQAGVAGRRAQHPGPAGFTDGEVTLEAGSGDEAQASEALEADRRRRGHLHRLQPAATCSTGSARIDGAGRAHLRSPSRPSPPCSPAQAGADGEADLDFRYLLMPVRLQG